MLCLFVRYLPMVAMAEVKGALKEASPHYHPPHPKDHEEVVEITEPTAPTSKDEGAVEAADTGPPDLPPDADPGDNGEEADSDGE